MATQEPVLPTRQQLEASTESACMQEMCRRNNEESARVQELYTKIIEIYKEKRINLEKTFRIDFQSYEKGDDEADSVFDSVCAADVCGVYNLLKSLGYKCNLIPRRPTERYKDAHGQYRVNYYAYDAGAIEIECWEPSKLQELKNIARSAAEKPISQNPDTVTLTPHSKSLADNIKIF